MRVTFLIAAASLLVPVLARAQEGSEPGLSLSAAYVGDLRRNSGGMRHGAAYGDALDLGATWITDFFGPRLTSNVSVTRIGGEGISARYVGDLQGANGYEAAPGWTLYESWVELGFGDGGSTVRAGMLDLNAEFDAPVTQGMFTASPFGMGSELAYTGPRGPATWPTTGLGVRAAGTFSENLQWRFGAYDAAPGHDQHRFTSTRVTRREGALVLGEIEYAGDRLNKLAFGAWTHSAKSERLDAALLAAPPRESGNHGFYAHLDLRIASSQRANFDAALRAGTAASRFNTFDGYVGVAVTATHFWTARPDDGVGLGVAWAHTGDEYRALRAFDGLPASTAETLFELVYRAEIAPWLSVLPNVQFVHDPGADPFVGDAWIAGIRFEISRDHTWPLQARRGGPSDGPYARTEK